MALTGAHAARATPLTEEDIRGLRIESITTQGELNEAEAVNIIRGQEWALRSRTVRLADMLNDDYLKRLHAEMFGEVWRWAGEFRQRDTNIGASPHQIRSHLRQLYDEVRSWLDFKSYPADEIAIRLHYRVVTFIRFRTAMAGTHACSATSQWCGISKLNPCLGAEIPYVLPTRTGRHISTRSSQPTILTLRSCLRSHASKG